MKTTAHKYQYRIANWNVDRPKSNKKKNSLIIQKINEINAEIIVLTETSNSINLETGYLSAKSKNSRKNPDEQWITIWSKWEIVKQFSTFDNYRTAAAIIKAPFGEILIYGTIIPYHAAGVNGNRYEQSGYKAWQLHYEDIVKQSADWNKLMTEHKEIPFLLIGDFNQTRDFLPKGYGTKTGRDLLSKVLGYNNLQCLTEIDFAVTKHLSIDPKKGRVRRNIDHICISNKWLKTLSKIDIGAWNHFDRAGIFMSDHNGVYFDFNV